MTTSQLTWHSIETRPVLVPLNRPVVSKVGRFDKWPLILIDLHTEQGITGRAYLAPYLVHSMRYLIPAIHDLVEARKGQPLAPVDEYRAGRKALSLIGLEGTALIAISGLDMAAWDARAKAADLPLGVLLGGSIGPVKAYNSNGLWLHPIEKLGPEAAALVAEGGYTAVKLRLGRDRIDDDRAAIRAVRDACGDDIKIMVDFNQGLTMDQALILCHALDDEGLIWLEEPIAYDNFAGYAQLTRELKTPVTLGENFYGPRTVWQAIQAGAGDLAMPDLMRIGGVTGWIAAAAIMSAVDMPMSNHLYPEFSAHLMRVTETAHWLESVDWAHPILANPYPVTGGHIQIPEVSGVGLEWNEEGAKRYAYE
jgi:mandelate racemase